MGVPGFLNGARYVPVGSGPQYMAFYELESPDTINHPHLVELRTRPRWIFSKFAGVGRSILNHVYKQIVPPEVSPEAAQSGMAEFLAIEIMDIPSEAEDEFNDWYNATYLPRLEMEPGCIRGRRYIMARGRNTESPKEPRYANVYELEDEKAYERAKVAIARDATPRTREMLAKAQHAQDFPCVFKRQVQL